MKKYFKFLTFVTLGLVLWYFLAMFTNNNISKGERLIHAAEKRAAKNISNKYQMRAAGSGGSMKKSIATMSALSFYSESALNLKTARRLVLACINDFLEVINTDEELRPYLVHYPFTENDIDLTIFFTDITGRTIYDPFLCTASASHGKIDYSTTTPELIHRYRYKSSEEETIEEAKRIVATENLLQETS